MNAAPIVVISGLPEAGVPMLVSLLRQCGVRSEEGYCSRNMRITSNVVIPWLELQSLPLDRRYRIIVLRRNLGEVVFARVSRLSERGVDPLPSADRVLHHLRRGFRQLLDWQMFSAKVELCHISHAELVNEPTAIVQQVQEFLGFAKGLRDQGMFSDGAAARHPIRQASDRHGSAVTLPIDMAKDHDAC